MIYVSQGHQQGIGLEVFLKSFICLSKESAPLFHLVCYQEDLKKILDLCFLKYTILNETIILNSRKLKVTFLEKVKDSKTLDCLNHILDRIKPSDILLTLPTSKDQLKFENKNYNGYTEYLRYKYKNSNITMNFLSHDQSILLLSDHISIEQVPNNLSEENILEKTITTLDLLPALRNIKKIYFAGIDPHCGENGLISKHDSVFQEVLPKLRERYPEFDFYGPLPADTIHLKFHNTINKLFIYAYHDQGLNPFKLRNGLMGINLTLGLPFIRLSVDHGTAFDLFGKNRANYLGMSYLVNEIVNWQKKSPT